MLTIVQNTTRIEDDNMVPIPKIHIQWEEIYDTNVIMYGLSHDRTMLIASIMNNIGQINIDQGLESVRVEISSIITGVSRKNHVDLELHPIEGKKVVGVDMNIDHGRDITSRIDLLMYDSNTIKRMTRKRKEEEQSRHQHDMHVI